MKKAKFTLVLLFSFLLSACSSSFVYNNIDWLLYWYVGDYVDLSTSQKAKLDERIASWQDWHRSTELKQYQTQLQNLKVQLSTGPLNQQQWLNEFDETQQHINRFRAKVAPELAELAQQLSQEQVEGILSAWQKKRQERQDEFDGRTEDERLRNREKRLIESIEENIGTLDTRQINLIKHYSYQYISTSDERTAYQNTLQEAVREIFSNRNTSSFKQRLASLIRNPDQYKSPRFQADLDHNMVLYAQMLAELNLTLSQEQKRKLNNQIEEWIQLIEGLISD